MSTPAGWYPDPEADDGSQRWWDGESWTDHRAPAAAPAPATETPPPPSGGGPQWDAPPPSSSAGQPQGGYQQGGYQQGGYQQGGYQQGGYQQGGVASSSTTNGKAITSLVLSIVWLAGLGSILAIVLGFVARREIKERGQRGNGMAVSGIVIGVLGLLGAVVFWAGVLFVTSGAGEDLVEGADLSIVSQLQNAYRSEFGEYASSIDELVDGIDSTGNDSNLELEGFDDVRIVRADADSFCAESTLSGETRHIGEGGFVSQAGSCPPA